MSSTLLRPLLQQAPKRLFLSKTNTLRLASSPASSLLPKTTPRTFTTTSPAATMSGLSANGFIEHLENRRSYYSLQKEGSPKTPAEVDALVGRIVQAVPSSFNSQSNRVVVLHGAHHDRFWGIAHEVLEGIVPAEQFATTAQKLAGFKAAAGTVLFFEDLDTINEFKEKFAIYADKFGTWATQSGAMLQYSVWTALESEGFGANLQHYNPLVDAKVRAEWDLPASWQLSAQLVFGAKAGDTYPKETKPLEGKFKSFA